MSQDGLATRGREIGVEFDRSWISLWELRGPRPSFVKGQVYLQLIQADLGVVNDMIHARVEFPGPAALSVSAAIERCRALVEEGSPRGAFGVVVQALRDHEPDSAGSLAPLYLTASIVARSADLLFLARHYIERAMTVSQGTAVESRVAAKIAIEGATLAIHHGDLARAARLLRQIGSAVLGDDPAMAADVEQARSRLAGALGDARTALLHLERCRGLIAQRAGTERTAQILACISFYKAELGRGDDAVEAADAALESISGARHPLALQEVLHSAAQTYMRVGKLESARNLLVKAEQIARETERPLRLFAIRMSMLDLARRSSDQPLSRLLRRRLHRDRQLLVLPPSLEGEYTEVTRQH